jgi:hypothetical protein
MIAMTALATTVLRAVDVLIDHDEIPRHDLLPKTSAGGDRHEKLDAEPLHAPDVRAIVDLRRTDAVAAAVSREEDDLPAFQSPDDERVRCRSERRLEHDLLAALEAFQVVEAAASQDSDSTLGHGGELLDGIRKARRA